MEKKESYTPAEAKRAYGQLDRLVAERALKARQAGASPTHREPSTSSAESLLQRAGSAASKIRDRDTDGSGNDHAVCSR
jgi:hypothetical protein